MHGKRVGEMRQELRIGGEGEASRRVWRKLSLREWRVKEEKRQKEEKEEKEEKEGPRLDDGIAESGRSGPPSLRSVPTCRTDEQG